MAKVENIGRLLEKLRKRRQAAKDENCSIVVGYTAAYALFVHENLTARHTVGRAKFLEQPVRELRTVIRAQVIAAMQGGQSLPMALLVAGLHLQRESQKLVPVDTGNLRASAFTRRES